MVPRITVLMPVYNTVCYLCQAIKSMVAQIRTDFELLIINDVSTDISCKTGKGEIWAQAQPEKSASWLQCPE